MKKILLYVLLMLIIIKVNGQATTYYKLDYSGNASGNNIQMEVEHIFSATNINRLEFSFNEPFSFGHDNAHNSQTIQNFNVHPAPDITYSDGNRKTYIYTDINAPNFTFKKTYNAATTVNLGGVFASLPSLTQKTKSSKENSNLMFFTGIMMLLLKLLMENSD